MADNDCEPVNFAASCEPSNGVFWKCSGQTLLQQRYAAEYATLNGISADYYVNKDQFERQLPGPSGNASNFDPLYMEPATYVRPETEDRVAETWNFREPAALYVVIADRTVEREAGELGTEKTVRYTLHIPMFSLLSSGCVTDRLPSDYSIGIADIARVGDVIYLGGSHSVWLDVDVTERRGFVSPDLEHVWVEVEAVTRSKYVPSRKDELPGKDARPPASAADSATQTGNNYRRVEDHVNDPFRAWE